ncbi:MAG: hypothetical protein KKF48_04175 [Nanoarchaeota archaeon]|nr:hypothetical protein [Nanoarchaeota archaeon]MBU1028216.1 hypothetical protein [Nanoarchaeota archaeon]
MAINKTTYQKKFVPDFYEEMNSGVTKKVYKNNKEDRIINDLIKICIHLKTNNWGSDEFSQFLLATENSTSEIIITAKHPYNYAGRSSEKYVRKVEIRTMPAQNPQKELTDILTNKGFELLQSKLR